jgi:hypothetical protein
MSDQNTNLLKKIIYDRRKQNLICVHCLEKKIIHDRLNQNLNCVHRTLFYLNKINK